MKPITMTRVKGGWTLHVDGAPVVYERWGTAQEEWAFVSPVRFPVAAKEKP